MKITIFYLSCISLCLSACSTTKDTVRSAEQIQNLKKCGLAVKLITRNQQIDQLTKLGNTAKANQIRTQVKNFNSKTIQDISEYYDFSEVYYFYSSDRNQLRQQDVSNKLLNKNLEPIRSSDLKCSAFLVLEYGHIDSSSNQNMLKLASKWVFKDKSLRPLRQPFPYVKNTLDCFGSKNSTPQIRCLNHKLHKYFDKVTGQQ